MYRFSSNRDYRSPVLLREVRAGFQPLLSDASQKTRIPQGLWGRRDGNLQMVGIDDDIPSVSNLLGSLMDGNRFKGSHTQHSKAATVNLVKWRLH